VTVTSIFWRKEDAWQLFLIVFADLHAEQGEL
jgi:hypothetical protein